MASQCAVRKVKVEGAHAAKAMRNCSWLLSAGYENLAVLQKQHWHDDYCIHLPSSVLICRGHGQARKTVNYPSPWFLLERIPALVCMASVFVGLLHICSPLPVLCNLFVFQTAGPTVPLMHTSCFQIHSTALIKFDILASEEGNIINSTLMTSIKAIPHHVNKLYHSLFHASLYPQCALSFMVPPSACCNCFFLFVCLFLVIYSSPRLLISLFTRALSPCPD